MTSAPFFYYKINNQQPGMKSTYGLTFGLVLICALIGSIIPVYTAKIKLNSDWEKALSASLRQLNDARENAIMNAMMMVAPQTAPDHANIPG